MLCQHVLLRHAGWCTGCTLSKQGRDMQRLTRRIAQPPHQLEALHVVLSALPDQAVDLQNFAFLSSCGE